MHELQRIYDAVGRIVGEGRRGLLVTVISTSGSTYRRAGARSVIGEDGSVDGAISGGCVERDIAERAKSWLDDFAPRIVTYDSSSPDDIVFGLGLGCRGLIEMLVEPFDSGNPPRLPPLPQGEPIGWETAFEGNVVLTETIEPQKRIVIFGRGPDCEPVAVMARATGWRADVIRSYDRPDLSGVDAIVIMTHNFLHDVALVEAAFASSATYIGLLGPKVRGEEILTQIGEVSPAMCARLYNPAGLDLGADTPEEIALAIVAEVLSVFRRAAARPLRVKEGPIHEPAGTPIPQP
ncbi:MAG TPA: XdhC family protein [Thermoanaerobaculia bacterium]